MREIQEAYKATVVLLALLDTLWTNTNALGKVLRDGVMTQLAKKYSQLYTQAERLQADVRALETGDEEYYTQCTEEDLKQHAKNLRRAARKMNRESRTVARFFDIPTTDMYASQLIRRMK